MSPTPTAAGCTADIETVADADTDDGAVCVPPVHATHVQSKKNLIGGGGGGGSGGEGEGGEGGRSWTSEACNREASSAWPGRKHKHIFITITV